MSLEKDSIFVNCNETRKTTTHDKNKNKQSVRQKEIMKCGQREEKSCDNNEKAYHWPMMYKYN